MEWHIVLTVWILLAFFAQFGQCCGPAEIDQQYTITLTAKVPTDAIVTWQIGNGVALIYDSSLDDPNLYPNLYIGTRTQLTILKVSKDDGRTVFSHYIKGGSEGRYNCALPVYKKASTPTCESVTLQGNKIRTKCTSAEVFPQAKCQFTLQNGGTATRNITDDTPYITYTHTGPQSGGNEYYSTFCTLQYPVDGLKPGNWTVQVNMYPNLTAFSLAQGTVGQAAHALSLSIPTPNIDLENNSCPKGLTGEGNTNVRQGYIRQGERASCLCTRAHAGNPPGTVGWTPTQGGNFIVLSQSEDEATIQINSHDTFTCESFSVLDGSHSATYTPKYAHGPSSASLTFQRPGPIYLCPTQQTNIDITCQAPANSLSPAAVFTIRYDTSNNVVTKVAGDTAWSKSVNYSFTKSGQHIFTCKVENVIFSDINIEAPAANIQVYAPPNSPPLIQVTSQYVKTSDSVTWVKQGSNISLSCLAGDAYPSASSVTVTCGQNSTSTGQLSLTGVSGDKQMCQCAVDHETKIPCSGLNLTKEITIQTAYGPNETKISFADDELKEVSNEPLNFCTSDGLNVTVICLVKQSDVRPGLTLDDFRLIKSNTINNYQTHLDTSDGENYRSVNKLKITAGGSHILSCEARNPKFPAIKKTMAMTIEVRVPPSDVPKISSRSSQNGDILVEGDDVTVACEVTGGFPPVQSAVILTCGQDQSVTSNGSSAELILSEIGLSYNETNCTCQATHVTGCYYLTADHTLIVMMGNETRTQQEKSPPIGAAVGGAFGAFLIIAVVGGGMFYIRRRMKKKEHPRADDEVFIENVVYGTPVQDYTAIKTTTESATAPPKNYNPESLPSEKEDNPYENVKLDRKSLVRTSSKTTPALAAKPKYPGTSVKTKAVQKPSEKDQNNPSGETEYTTVDKTKTEHSQSSDHDQIADITSAGASGEIPEVPDRHYNPEEIKDSIKEPSTSKPSKGKKKNIKEKTAKKEKETKDKKEKKKKGKNKDEHHVYSNKAFDQSGDGEVYANIGTSMKSSNDVDDGMHKNKDGLVYTTIVGVGSLKGGQRPVHHSRKEAPVDYADIDFNKIVANREDQD